MNGRLDLLDLGVRAHILITGGTGFVGKHLQSELRRRGISFFCFSRDQFDLTRWEQAQAVFERNRHATALIHLAGFQAAGEFPGRHPAEQLFVNNLIHTHVLECWRRFIPQARLFALGSSCAYPTNAAKLTEPVLLDGPVHGSVYAYASTKRLLYTGILAYNDQYGLDGSFLIPATLFGEHDDFNPATAHVPGALIGKFVRAVREDLPEVEIWGDGSQVRDFLDVKEFVRALLLLLGRCQRDIVNVCPGAGTSIRELATIICEASGFRGELKFNPNRYVGIREKFLDSSRLREKYGLAVTPDIRAGIARTVAWGFENYTAMIERRKFADAPIAVG